MAAILISEQTAVLPIAHLVRAMRDEREARRRLLRRIAMVYLTVGCSLLVGVFGIGALEAAGMDAIDVPAPRGQIIPFNTASILVSTSTDRPTPSLPSMAFEGAFPADGTNPNVAVTATASPGGIDASASASVTPTAMPTVAPDHSAVARIEIPSIEVSAPVVALGVDADGVMQSPRDPTVVGWYAFTSHPLDFGNAVFSGHLDDITIGPAVFWRLGDLRAGDEITVGLQDGSTVLYQVRSKALVEFDTDDATFQRIVGPTTKPSITFITCAGRFDSVARSYDQRLIVRAERTSVAQVS